jgi:hypothetical protein
VACEGPENQQAQMEFESVSNCVCGLCANPCASSCSLLGPPDAGAGPDGAAPSDAALSPTMDASRVPADASDAGAGADGASAQSASGCSATRERDADGGAIVPLAIAMALIALWRSIGRSGSNA